MKRLTHALVSAGRDEDGLILPLALIALLVLAALSGALLAIGSTEVPIAGNHLQSIQAQYLAEAGLEDAFDALRRNPTNVQNAPAALTAVPSLNGASPTLATFGGYTVKYQKAGGNTVKVIATGCVGSADCSSARATKVLTAVLTNNFAIDTAVLFGANYTMDGNARIQGTCGSMHTNGNLSGSGNPTISKNLTAHGTDTLSGTPIVGGIRAAGQPIKTVPPIDPAAFLATAKAVLPANQVFQMKANGQVLDGNNALITTVASGGTYQGWVYSPGPPVLWTFPITGVTGYDGTYYFEGNAKLDGNAGTVATPWKTSIIATGTFIVDGSPIIQAHLPDTLFVSTGDILVDGGPTLGYSGLIASHGQVAIKGNAVISGYIIAEGVGAGTGGLTPNVLGDDPTITFNCGSISPPMAGTLKILSWGQ